MPRRRGASALACAVALALITTACSPANNDPDKPRPGGVLNVAVRDLATLDPAHASGRGALFVVSQLWDSLTEIDPATGDAIPAAATKWETSGDGKTWTFHLNPGARFHDGDTVTAGDFKLAFDRIVDRKTNSDAAFQLESVRGFRDSRVLGTSPKLAGVTIVNPTTLRIALDKPFADLAVFVAHPALAPLPHKAYRRNPKGFEQKPVGNGPFQMEAARKPGEVVLVRNENYTGTRALLDRLVVRLYDGAEDAWRAFLDKDMQVAEVPASALAAGAGKFGIGGFTPFWASVYYGANIRKPNLSPQAVRQAISLAIDRVKIARNVYGGTKTAATGLVPLGVAGYQPDRCSSCEHDVERAKGLIRNAFKGQRKTITIDHLDASPSREVARAIGADLQAVGLGVAYRAHTSQKYLTLLQRGEHELAELGWLAEVPSPDGFLAQQLRTKSPNNQTGFSSTKVDGLIDKARAEQDRAQRLDLYRQAEVEALARMPLIPIVFFRNHVAVAEGIRDLQIDGAGLFDAAKVWIAKPQ